MPSVKKTKPADAEEEPIIPPYRSVLYPAYLSGFLRGNSWCCEDCLVAGGFATVYFLCAAKLGKMHVGCCDSPEISMIGSPGSTSSACKRKRKLLTAPRNDAMYLGIQLRGFESVLFERNAPPTPRQMKKRTNKKLSLTNN